jgi:hypothetical protein
LKHYQFLEWALFMTEENQAAATNPTSVWDRRYSGGPIVLESEITSADIQYLDHPFLWMEGAGKRLLRDGDADHMSSIVERHMSHKPKRMLALGSGTVT